MKTRLLMHICQEMTNTELFKKQETLKDALQQNLKLYKFSSLFLRLQGLKQEIQGLNNNHILEKKSSRFR